MEERPALEFYYGVPLREPYPSELDFFRANPNVAGMATEDDQIIINPRLADDPQNYRAVAQNEAVRVLLRQNELPRPKFELDPELLRRFGAYSSDPQDIRETVAARWISGDPSAPAPSTPEQASYLDALRFLLSRRQ